jgi:hypothetical protein
MRRLSFVALAVIIVACDTAPTGTVNPEDAGNYVLRSINDTLLPYTLLNNSSIQLSVVSDTIFMGVDGRFVDRTHYRRVLNGVTDFPADTLSGTWTVKGATVAFTSSTGENFAATLSAQQLIMVGGGLKSTYTK